MFKKFCEQVFTNSINRNIVECKADTMRKLLVDIGVLIETLWNVKVVDKSLSINNAAAY